MRAKSTALDLSEPQTSNCFLIPTHIIYGILHKHIPIIQAIEAPKYLRRRYSDKAFGNAATYRRAEGQNVASSKPRDTKRVKTVTKFLKSCFFVWM